MTVSLARQEICSTSASPAHPYVTKLSPNYSQTNPLPLALSSIFARTYVYAQEVLQRKHIPAYVEGFEGSVLYTPALGAIEGDFLSFVAQVGRASRGSGAAASYLRGGWLHPHSIRYLAAAAVQ